MMDPQGNYIETPNGKYPSTFGQDVSIYTPTGLVPAIWLGDRAEKR